MAKGYCAAQWYGDKHLDCVSQCFYCSQQFMVIKRDYGNGAQDYYMLPQGEQPDVNYPVPATVVNSLWANAYDYHAQLAWGKALVEADHGKA